MSAMSARCDNARFSHSQPIKGGHLHLRLLDGVYPRHGHQVEGEDAPWQKLDAILCKGVGKVRADPHVPPGPLHDCKPKQNVPYAYSNAVVRLCVA
jgi:hypothetical protein